MKSAVIFVAAICAAAAATILSPSSKDALQMGFLGGIYTMLLFKTL